jgi:hypothetical protein
MPAMSQSSIPSASHTTAPRERRFSGPSDSGAKPARYPGVYQVCQASSWSKTKSRRLTSIMRSFFVASATCGLLQGAITPSPVVPLASSATVG